MTGAEQGLVGQLLDQRYRVLRVIGKGGMGAVYEVEHVHIGRRFALKTLLAPLAMDGEAVARFHREARIAGKIGSPHIVEVNDLGHLPDGAPYFVMELLSGSDLGQLLEEQGPMPIARLAGITIQVCDALGAAHAKGIVHRDLKPQNVFLVADGTKKDWVKVLDFGISKVRDSARGIDDLAKTGTGTAIGTPYFMSPEQARGDKSIDARTDVYALGVVLFEALTGTCPYQASSLAELVLKIVLEEPPSIVAIRADVPRELEAVVHRAMARDREHRYATMAELASALAPFASVEVQPQMTVLAPPAARAETPQAWESADPRPARVRRRTLATLTVAVAVSAGVALALPGLVAPTPSADHVRTAAARRIDHPIPPPAPIPADRPEPVPPPADPLREADPLPEETAPRAPVGGPVAPASPERPDASDRPGPVQETRPSPSPEGSHAPARPAPPAQSDRTITVHNERPAAVDVLFTCGGRDHSVRVAAFRAASVDVRAGQCDVVCRGIGDPRCPLRLSASQSSFVVHR